MDDLIKKRTDQICNYTAYKQLIIRTFNLSEIGLLENEDLNLELENDAKRVIDEMLDYYIQNQQKYKQGGYAFIFALYTDENTISQEKIKSKSYFRQMIRIITNMIKNEKVIGPFKKKLFQFSQSIIAIIQSTKMFLESLQQGHQIKFILQDLKIFSVFLKPKQNYQQNILNKVSKRSLKFIKLVEKIYQAKLKIQQQGSESTKKQSFLQAGYEILKMYPRNIFQEITLNRLKKILENFFPRKQSQAALPYCCTLYFCKQASFIKMEQKNHEHKDYHWPLELEKILKHVRKTIVGFLNLEGGIIYIGMKEKEKCVQAKGIYLSQEQIIEFLEWLKKQCSYIYPEFYNQLKQEMEKMYEQSLNNLKARKDQKSYHYHINKYVSIEFLTMIDPNTDLDAIEENIKKFRKLYMLKIKIKPGTKAETFHLLKQDKYGEIECFKRNDTSVNKITFIDFINFFNQRIEAFMKEPVQQPEALWNQCPHRHFKQFCKESLV